MAIKMRTMSGAKIFLGACNTFAPALACWPWTGNFTAGGYGLAGNTTAHRVVYELVNGPIPEGLHIDHLCRNVACCNPRHMEAVTPKENNARRVALITHCRNGHPYDEANTHITKSGNRMCRACGRERAQAKRDVLKAAKPERTACRRGHERSTYGYLRAGSTTQWRCRACNNGWTV